MDTTLNLWTRRAVSTAYQEYINYDANGNIISNRRDGHKGEMDIMVYDYKPGTNRLRHVRDAIPANRYGTDIDNQLTDNYSYDAIGNLIADKSERIDTISWTVYGKIAGIKKRNGTIRYKYDAAGNRVYKQSVLDGKTNTSFYVRDAQGNVLGVYDLSDKGLTWEEQHLYGSSRLGVYRYGATLPLQPVTTRSASAVLQDSMAWGSRVYELSNHLGNVLATVSDKKLQVAGAGNTVAYYRAETLSANDYFAFGSLIEDRSFSVGNGYRYGYQGSEKDKELNTDTYTTFFRELDTRINRWWSPDPKSSASPWSSPYVVNGNNPVIMIDPLGDKEYESIKAYRKATGNKKLGQGDWLSKDRTGNTDVWKKANDFNLKKEKGFEEYTNIEQRAAFYGWFQEASDVKGFETKWAGAASQVAFAINELANPTMAGINFKWVAKQLNYTSDEASAFANTGNRMIFEDVFPKLRALYNGPAIKGLEAFNWDAMALSQEQNLIQPLYVTTKDFGIISAASKQLFAGSSPLAWLKDINIKPFPKNGNLMDVTQRWAYGMQGMGHKVVPSQMPLPGATYTNGTMYLRFRDNVDKKYWNTPH